MTQITTNLSTHQIGIKRGDKTRMFADADVRTFANELDNKIQQLESKVLFTNNEDNVIYYKANAKLEETSNTGSVAALHKNSFGNVTIVSHTFENGIGKVVFSGNVLQIGYYAFYECPITKITIPSTVTSIGTFAFYATSLTNVVLPIGLTSIGENVFTRTQITSIDIPLGVTSVGGGAFNFCYNIKIVKIPSSLLSISGNSFRTGRNAIIDISPNNTVYDSRDNCNAIIETSTNKIITGYSNSTIPSTVTGIGNDAFLGCSSLTNIIFPNGLISIGDTAFYNCGLTSVEIPNSVTSIGVNPFRGCNELTSIVVSSQNITYDSRNNCNAIIETSTNTLIQGCKNSTIPNSVTSIGESAFCGCSKLTSIEIPSSVTSIGEEAFDSCSKLTSVICRPTTPPMLNANAFARNGSGRKIYVPSDSVSAYKSASNWSTYASAIEAIPE